MRANTPRLSGISIDSSPPVSGLLLEVVNVAASATTRSVAPSQRPMTSAAMPNSITLWPEYSLCSRQSMGLVGLRPPPPSKGDVRLAQLAERPVG